MRVTSRKKCSRFERSFAALLAALVLLTGCARLEVTSNPPGAQVLWSATGTEGSWKPWPPAAYGEAWDDAARSSGRQTPLEAAGRYGDIVWITVDKDGYYRPLPKPAQLYLFRHEKLAFDLKETPQLFAQHQREKGLVLYGGEWVDPKGKGLREFRGTWMTAQEAEEREKLAQGLVKYKDEWLTPEARDTRFAEDQKAAGLILRKGRWVSPEVGAQEDDIDWQVMEIAAGDYQRLEPPKVIGRLDSGDCELQLVNSTSLTVRFLFSGPMSREVIVGPYRTATRLILPAGRYGVVAKGEVEGMPVPEDAPEGLAEATTPEMIRKESQVKPAYIEHPLAGGFKYIFNFDANMAMVQGGLPQYVPKPPELPENLPTIEIPNVEIPETQRPQWLGMGQGAPGSGQGQQQGRGAGFGQGRGQGQGGQGQGQMPGGGGRRRPEGAGQPQGGQQGGQGQFPGGEGRRRRPAGEGGQQPPAATPTPAATGS